MLYCSAENFTKKENVPTVTQVEESLLIKSLQSIRHLVANKLYRELEFEVITIQQETIFPKLETIIKLINKQNYKQVLQITNRMLQELLSEQQQYALKRKDEDDIIGLQTVGNILKVEISVLHYKKAELHRLINNFRLQHNRELGATINRILEIRQKLFFHELEDNPDKETDYQEAKADYEQFNKTFTESKERTLHQLNDNQRKELQKIFREASKLCHPDVVADESEQLASDIFSELNKAYTGNDLKRVNEIFNLLLSKKIHLIGITESVSEKELLETANTKLSKDIERLKLEIAEIENSNSFIVIQDITDWNKYFDKLKKRMSLELEKLETQLEENS